MGGYYRYLTKDPSSQEEIYNIRKTLTFCMKTAIKKSVKDQALNVRRELNHKDFSQVSKITFDAKDPANLIGKVFKFKDYAPAVFKVTWFLKIYIFTSQADEGCVPYIDTEAKLSDRRARVS